MRLARLALSAVAGSFLGAVIPIAALVLLAPASYGSFSTIYLFFAYGVSLQYSIVSEAWARARREDESGFNWAHYSVTLGALAAVVALAAFVTSLLIPELRSVAWLLGLAVLFGVYRSGARYYWLALSSIRRVVLSDLVGIIALVVAFTLLHHQEPILGLAAAWCLSTGASAAALGFPLLRRGTGPSSWLRKYGRQIKPLLADSLLMDAGAIGTPFLLAGFMGADKFGIYRGIANAAMPVRLMVDPLRPALGRKAPEFFFRKTSMWLIGGVTGAIGVACYFALAWLLPGLPVRLGTLSELVIYAEPAAIFAAANFVGTVFYIVCRTNADRKTIMIGRICQTIAVVAMPVIGFFSQGLSGAIWGFAISASVSGLIWVVLAVPPIRDPDIP